MGWEADNGVLYCNTADCHFGPQCESDDEAIDLGLQVARFYRDPRAVTDEALEAELKLMRGESVVGNYSVSYVPYSWSKEDAIFLDVGTYEDVRVFVSNNPRKSGYWKVGRVEA